MTAIATIFALAPMALGVTGGGMFISQPLAIVVSAGPGLLHGLRDFRHARNRALRRWR